MYVSYSGAKKYWNCKFAYWNDYVNKTPQEKPDDRLGSIYGSVVGTIFEDFYMLKLWKEPKIESVLMGRVEETVDRIIQQETTPRKGRPGGVLMWKGEGKGLNPDGMYASREELILDIRDTIPRGVRSIRQHRLLGLRADAEFKLDHTVEGHILGGRADFIIERIPPKSDTIIVDGKGSRHRDKYVDPQQLFWYSMLFWLHSGKKRMPDKAAFLFWRYEPDKSVDWVDVNEDEVEELFDKALTTARDITAKEKLLVIGTSPTSAKGVFTPTPNEDNCRFCPYATDRVCPEGKKIADSIEKKRQAAKERAARKKEGR